MLDDQGIASLQSCPHMLMNEMTLMRPNNWQRTLWTWRNNARTKCFKCRQPFELRKSISQKAILVRPMNLLKVAGGEDPKPSLLREIQNAQALLSIRANDISSLDWWIKIICR